MGKELYTLILVFILGGTGILSSQSISPGMVATTLESRKINGQVDKISTVFHRIEHTVISKRSVAFVENSDLLSVRKETIAQLIIDQNELILVTIPFEDTNLELELYRASPLSTDFRAETSGGRVISSVSGLHYRGIIKGNTQSLVSISFWDGEVMGMISSAQLGNVVIGKWKEANDLHIIYRESSMTQTPQFSCDAEMVPGSKPFLETHQSTQRSASANCIKIYFETSYTIYQNKSSDATEVLNFVSGFFNQVATIYANEGVNIEMSEVYVWTTPDPYDHGTASDALDSFMEGRPSFNGDLGHFLDISGNGNGGRAYINVLCGSFNVGYSDIAPSYSGFPTYSWTVNVVAHELGHNLGSYHTQDCIWGPDNCAAIDGCATPNPSTGCGTCDPAPVPNKGTIMSYCHLSTGNGIDFNLGFGAEPGDLIRSVVNAASCLTACGSGGGSGGCSLAIESVDVINASCSQTNGTITVLASGSNSATTYDIGHGPQSSNVFENLAPGDYSILVRNGSDCEQESGAMVGMSSDAPLLAATVTNATCGASDGMVELTATEGSAPYSYRIGSTTQSNPIFAGLPAGPYVATVTDNDGCSTDKAVTVFTESAPNLSVSIQHTSCGLNNAQIELSTASGTAPFTYSVDNQNSNSGTFVDLSAGSHTIRVLDANGCSDTQSVNINSSNPIDKSVVVSNTSCAESNGEIKIDATGGSGKLLFSIGEEFGQSSIFANVAAGVYDVQVKDDAECLISTSVAVEASESFAIDVEVEATTCALDNGTIRVSASGEGPYNYQLNNEDQSTNPVFDNLNNGSYSISVSDQEGCVVRDEIEVPNSTNPKMSTHVDRTHCGLTNGQIEVLVEKGIAPYRYRLNDGSFQDQAIFQELSPDQYKVVVRDAEGCLDSSTVFIDSSQRVLAHVQTMGTMCGKDNGSMTISASQGIAPFSYHINGETFQDSLIENLPAGLTGVVVQDADLCSYEDSVLIEASAGIELAPMVAMTTCAQDNGSIIIVATGGNGSLLYQLDTNGYAATNEFNLLPAGNYRVMVKDELQCVEERELEIMPSTNPRLDIHKIDTRCGKKNGSMAIDVDQGSAPFQIFQNGNAVALDLPLEGLGPGEYKILVQDAQNCTDTNTVVIAGSSAPIVATSAIPASCAQSNGRIEINVSNGAMPYTYSIGTEYLNQNIFTDLDSGTYNVTVRDANLCTDSVTLTLPYDDQYLSPVLLPESPLCSGETAFLQTGLSDNLHVTWTHNGDTLPIHQPMYAADAEGVYIAAVQYHDQCNLSASTVVKSRPAPIQDLRSSDTICKGEQFIIKDTQADYSYTWNNDSIGTAIGFQESGRYHLTVTNEYNCTLNLPLELEVTQPVVLSTLEAERFVCQGDTIDLSVSGAQTYHWFSEGTHLDQFHGSKISVSPESTARYSVIGSNGCFSDTLSILVDLFTDQFALADTQIIEGAPLHLLIENAEKTTWGADFKLYCEECIDPIIRPTISGKAWVDYIDDHGCAWNDTIVVDIIPLKSILPSLINVITPNQDGRNDMLVFDGLDVFEQVNIEVFNQDGQVLFRRKDYQNNWNGTVNGEDLPEGVYFYVLQVLLDDRVFHLDSDLTIVRD